MAKKMLLEMSKKLMEKGSSRSGSIPGRRSTAKEADNAGIIVGKERVARYGRNEQLKGASKGIGAAETVSSLPAPDIEESDVMDSEGKVDASVLERGRVKPKLRGYKGPESEMKSGGKVAYKAKGGKVAPRGCGVAMRGYGKAMKGK